MFDVTSKSEPVLNSGKIYLYKNDNIIVIIEFNYRETECFMSTQQLL